MPASSMSKVVWCLHHASYFPRTSLSHSARTEELRAAKQNVPSTTRTLRVALFALAWSYRSSRHMGVRQLKQSISDVEELIRFRFWERAIEYRHAACGHCFFGESDNATSQRLPTAQTLFLGDDVSSCRPLRHVGQRIRVGRGPEAKDFSL
ncbi:unnamed protein product [Durusdinium trenchii]|uniref:Uncharacterized protein n=1 Tax=Durusdinium trenchii TaxID=1381693 RepID=A0ABP0K2C5_9DINO